MIKRLICKIIDHKYQTSERYTFKEIYGKHQAFIHTNYKCGRCHSIVSTPMFDFELEYIFKGRAVIYDEAD